MTLSQFLLNISAEDRKTITSKGFEAINNMKVSGAKFRINKLGKKFAVDQYNAKARAWEPAWDLRATDFKPAAIADELTKEINRINYQLRTQESSLNQVEWNALDRRRTKLRKDRKKILTVL